MLRKPSIADESNHKQERFVWTEIIFPLRKNGGYILSGLGGRSFPEDKQAGRLPDKIAV